MSIKILIDMNLSPDWVPVLEGHGWRAVHWSTVGDPHTVDRTIMDWAVTNGYIVFTHVRHDVGPDARKGSERASGSRRRCVA